MLKLRLKLWWECIIEAPTGMTMALSLLIGWLPAFTMEMTDGLKRQLECKGHKYFNISDAPDCEVWECEKCGKIK